MCSYHKERSTEPRGGGSFTRSLHPARSGIEDAGRNFETAWHGARYIFCGQENMWTSARIFMWLSNRNKFKDHSPASFPFRWKKYMQHLWALTLFLERKNALTVMVTWSFWFENDEGVIVVEQEVQEQRGYYLYYDPRSRISHGLSARCRRDVVTVEVDIECPCNVLDVPATAQTSCLSKCIAGCRLQ